MTKKTKKSLAVVLAVLLIATFMVTTMVACEENTVGVVFMNGDETVVAVNLPKGSAVPEDQIPADPVKEGYTFEGWYCGEVKFEKTATFEANTVFTAKFTEIPATEYTVTFKNGDTVVKTVTVEEGATIAEADLPADLTEEGSVFDGWFNGEVEFDKTAAVTANATYTAKFTKNAYAVKFFNGETEVASVTVKHGETVAVEDIPVDPELKAHIFDGWFNGEVAFDETAVVTASATYTAKFTKSHYIVDFFSEGQQVGESVLVEIAADAKLLATDIPEDAVKADYAFMGWYNGQVEAVAELAVTEDVVYTALFNNEESYAGNWISTETGKEWNAVIDVESNQFTFGGLSKETYKYDATTGTLTYSDGSGYSAETWTFKAIGTSLYIEKSYYNEYEELAVDSFVAERKAATELAGTYSKGLKTYYVVGEDGIVTSFGTSALSYGYLYNVAEGQYKLDIKTGKYASVMSIDVTFDANGNMVAVSAASGSTNYVGIFVKDATVGEYYSSATGDYLYSYTKNENTFWHYYNGTDKTTVSATVVGEIVLDGEITVSYGDVTGKVAKISKEISGTTAGNFIWASAERGTYTCAGGPDVFVDGFGTLTINTDIPMSSPYYINAANVAVMYTQATNGKYTVSGGATFDTVAMTYALVNSERDGYQGSYVHPDSTSYVMTLDGMGGVLVENYSTYSEKYNTSSSYPYKSGTYTVEGNSITIANAGYYKFNGTFTLEDGNNVLLASDGKAILKEGYVLDITVAASAFDGYFVAGSDEITIDVAYDSYYEQWYANVIWNGAVTQGEFNWNGTILTFEAADVCASDANYTSTAVAWNAVIGNNEGTKTITITHECTIDWETTETKSVTLSYVSAMSPLPTGMQGTWYLNDATVEKPATTIVVTADTITVDSVAGTNVGFFVSYGGLYYSFMMNDVQYMIYEGTEWNDTTETYDPTGKWYYGTTDFYEAAELLKTQPKQPDGLAGTYVNGANEITLDGFGAGTLNDVAFTYTKGDGVYNVAAFGDYTATDNTFTVGTDAITVDFDNAEGTNALTGEFVKEKPAFTGTWEFEDSSANWYEYYFVFTETELTIGSHKYSDPDSYSYQYYNITVPYVAVDNVVTVNDALYYNWTFTLQDDGTLLIGMIDSDSYAGDLNGQVFTKR